jgi:hypothetical protein
MLADRPQGRRLSAAEQRQLEDLERRLLTGPLAPARPRPTGLAGLAARIGPAADRVVVLVGVVAACAVLVVAVVVGGPGGAVATAAALLATLITVLLPRATRRMSPTRHQLGRPR